MRASAQKPVSARKLAANRANAKKSTGPRTVAGKRRCSKNAVTHGLFCNDMVLPGEDRKFFEQFRHAVLLELRPMNVIELMIVDRIVIAQWKLRRLNSVEASAHCGINQHRLERSREELNQDRIEQFGTDEPDAAHAIREKLLEAEERKPNVINGIAVSAIHDEAYLERLSRHEQRLELSIHRNLRVLEKLRKQSHRSREDSDKRRLARCPFVPGEAYEMARALKSASSREHQIEESEPTECTESAGCAGLAVDDLQQPARSAHQHHRGAGEAQECEQIQDQHQKRGSGRHGRWSRRAHEHIRTDDAQHANQETSAQQHQPEPAEDDRRARPAAGGGPGLVV
jgi:hypothetical protein